MTTLTLTKDNFPSSIPSQGIALVDFWAEWCGPCRVFGPIFEAASEKHPDLTFGKVDTEDQQELANEFGISSIPTLMIFRDGVMLYNSPGAVPAEALDELIQAVKGLDMAEVWAEIEKQNSSQESS